MIEYSTNWMGPMAKFWWDERGLDINNPDHHYKGGRIDVYGYLEDEYPYGYEIDLPIIKSDCYYRFQEWLEVFTSKELLSFDQIKNLYEEETGDVIVFAPDKIGGVG